MLALVAVTNDHEAAQIPHGSIEGAADSSGDATFVAVRHLEAFAHDDDVIHLVYKNDEHGTFDVRSAVRVSLGTLEEEELESLGLADTSDEDD